ncbi:MAG: 2-oxo acid dehydrogenase subunit E2 [Planctomycetota bacterium]|nr:MAG: 2-oxo acid dehydrogenase subunit E2 [Planctomycetota bacterium]
MPSLPIRMPQLGESAAEATVREWLVEIGDSVSVDQDLIEVETEKSVLTVTAPASGTLISCDVPADTPCAVGGVLGHLEVDAETAMRHPSQPAESDAPTPAAPAQNSEEDEERRRQRLSATDEHLPVPAKAAGMGYFSPRVRARMSEYGINSSDIAGVRGSGRAGRVSVSDLDRFLQEVDSSTTTRATSMRMAVADSMRRSWQRPLATIAMEARMDALMEHRRSIPGRPSATVYGVRALAKALHEDDQPACRLVGDRLVHPEHMHIAIAIEVEGGVLNPVLEDPSQQSFADLTAAYDRAFAAGQERRTLGGSAQAVATVSNYGTFNILWATPVPLPDQSLILGMGMVRNVPDWDPSIKGWGRKRAAEITLTFDHRIADGGHAGRLLKRIIDYLEHPQKLE